MKIIALLIAIAGIYLYCARQTPVTEVAHAATGQDIAPLATGPKDAPPAPTNVLKRPIDRTHEVLGQVAHRNGAGEF
jgi:hypothetical protein